MVSHYNLDMVLALGFRVRSPMTVRFRQWAAVGVLLRAVGVLLAAVEVLLWQVRVLLWQARVLLWQARVLLGAEVAARRGWSDDPSPLRFLPPPSALPG